MTILSNNLRRSLETDIVFYLTTYLGSFPAFFLPNQFHEHTKTFQHWHNLDGTKKLKCPYNKSGHLNGIRMEGMQWAVKSSPL